MKDVSRDTQVKLAHTDWAWHELMARRELTPERSKPYLYGVAKRFVRMYCKEEDVKEKKKPEAPPVAIEPIESDPIFDLPEAPGSINFFFISPNGFNHQMSMRGWDYHQLIGDALEIEEYLLSLDCRPKHIGAPTEPMPAQGEPGHPETPAAPPPLMGPEPAFEDAYYDDLDPESEPQPQIESFLCTTLWGELKPQQDGTQKAYWKIRGSEPKFRKWGVRVWDEPLIEAGFSVERLDTSTTYSLQGYRAYFVRNEKGEAHKVVRLEKY